ncbi:MAG: glycosyltransferase family 2 protein [Candidatus Accumulibacter sp.]|jgi:glycosyltransferase involved in cell wall biosynthesis|nr:glycosyltransferase family 2 protein [Accumulibacter sp.]
MDATPIIPDGKPAVKLSVVVPCYNEEAVLPETGKRMTALFERLAGEGSIAAESEILLVDDGSRDGTWRVIQELAAASGWIRGLKLSRNRGHQIALLAGLNAAKGEAAISIDADLQDDIEVMAQMVEAYRAGKDVVFGVRKRRDTDTWFKRTSAELYYRLLGAMGVDVVFNHADYRLLSRRALEALKRYRETNLFLRGIIPQIGFPSSVVYYDRTERFAGESKYPLRKMLAFAWQGITAFSPAPLRAITGLGAVISLGSFVAAAWAAWTVFFTDAAVPGWASTVLPLYFLGGIQLLGLGVIGEYLAKIYAESKRRPLYFIEAEATRPAKLTAED